MISMLLLFLLPMHDGKTREEKKKHLTHSQVDVSRSLIEI